MRTVPTVMTEIKLGLQDEEEEKENEDELKSKNNYDDNRPWPSNQSALSSSSSSSLTLSTNSSISNTSTIRQRHANREEKVEMERIQRVETVHQETEPKQLDIQSITTTTEGDDQDTQLGKGSLSSPLLSQSKHNATNKGTNKSKNYSDDGDSSRWWRRQSAWTMAMPTIAKTALDNLLINNAILDKLHPHAGALHPNGTVGMIVNPSVKRLRPFDWTRDVVDRSVVCPGPDRIGIEGQGGYHVMQELRNGTQTSLNWIRRGQPRMTNNNSSSSSNYRINNNSNNNDNTTTAPLKILCMIYTHKGGHDRVQAIAQTWGRRCDGFFAASTVTNHSIGAIQLLHSGPEAYQNMWQKIRSMWTYVYNHYLNEFDYFHIGGDDLYLNVDNLRAYLAGPQVERLQNGYMDGISSAFHNETERWKTERPRPLLLGAPMISTIEGFRGVRPAGGAGYTLNRAALQLFGQYGADSFLTDMVAPFEDFAMGHFFIQHGVYVSNTQDAMGANRYCGSPRGMFHFDGIRSAQSPLLLRKRFGMVAPRRLNSVSTQAVAFHLKGDKKWVQQQNHTLAELIYRHHAILYNWCEEKEKQYE